MIINKNISFIIFILIYKKIQLFDIKIIDICVTQTVIISH